MEDRIFILLQYFMQVPKEQGVIQITRKIFVVIKVTLDFSPPFLPINASKKLAIQ